jgi:hypothetical protein
LRPDAAFCRDFLTTAFDRATVKELAVLDNGAIRDFAAALRHGEGRRNAEVQTRIDGIVERVAQGFGVPVTPRQSSDDTSPHDHTICSGTAAPILAAMRLIGDTHPAIVPKWDTVFDVITTALTSGGWNQVSLDNLDRFAAAAAIRRIGADKSHLLNSSDATWSAAFQNVLPVFRNQSCLQPAEAPKGRFTMFQEEHTGAAALLGVKQVSSAIRTLTLIVDFGACDPDQLTSAFLDAEFPRMLGGSTQTVKSRRISIDASTDRGGRDGLSINLKADTWPTNIVERLVVLGLPRSAGALEAQLEEAMY